MTQLQASGKVFYHCNRILLSPTWPVISLRQIYILLYNAYFPHLCICVSLFIPLLRTSPSRTFRKHQAHPYSFPPDCLLNISWFSMGPLVTEYPDCIHSLSVQATCHSSLFSLLCYILPEAVIGSFTLMLVFSSSDGFVWALVSLSGRLSGRLNWEKLPWVPFSCQAIKKKKSAHSADLQLYKYIQRYILKCYSPKDKAAGYLFWICWGPAFCWDRTSMLGD